MNRQKDIYYLGVAEAVGANSTCIRAKVGAIIVKNDQIISTGYAGAPRGRLDCSQIGKCFRQVHDIPRGSDYLLCRSVHAETNACLHAGRERALGGTLYMFGYNRICEWCARIILNVGIERCIIQGSITTPPIELWPDDLVFEPKKMIKWRENYAEGAYTTVHGTRGDTGKQ